MRALSLRKLGSAAMLLEACGRPTRAARILRDARTNVSSLWNGYGGRAPQDEGGTGALP